MSTPHLTASVRHVVEAATLAPSVHNTQPWRFAVRSDGFDLYADPARQLHVLDPTGRQLRLSCGTALATARVAARALGLDADVTLLPDDEASLLLARLTLHPGAPAGGEDIALALAVLKRHTVRGRFQPRQVPGALLRELARAVEAEGAALRPVSTADDRIELAVLLARADAVEQRDPAYRRELAAWVRDGTVDGIPAQVLPARPPVSSLRQRDFGGAQPDAADGTEPAEEATVLVLTTRGDGPAEWLVAGQALGMLLLRAAAAGVQASPLGQVVDLPGPRQALAAALGLTGTPQMVLRLGYSEARATTPRRDVDEVLV